jgi:hypothetical protein
VRPVVKKIRAGVAESPDQKLKPRRDGVPCSSGKRQISAPLSACSATTRSAAVAYSTPSTTSGVSSEPSSAAPSSAPSGYDHACRNSSTLVGEIWSSGEKRVPARSRL